MKPGEYLSVSVFPPVLRALGLFVLAFAEMASVAVAGDAVDKPGMYVLDTSVRHQIMDNFGANDAWSMQKVGLWSEACKNRIADLLFSTNSGIGLSCWRFNLGAGLNLHTIRDDWRTVDSFEIGAGEYDWSRQPGARWFLRAAKARGVGQFGATVYSPPLRLTRNGLSNLGRDTNSTTNLKPGAEDAFAQYLADILSHFKTNADPAERIDFDYIFPVNEPQWEWQHSQEGCRYSNGDLKRLYTAMHSRLAAAGLGTKILGPESGSIPDMYSLDDPAREKWHADYGNYLNWICGDPDIASCFGGIISYHSYWSDALPDKLVPHRKKLGDAFAKFSGWKVWQSEYCVMETGRDLGMDTALRVARIIHCDLTLVNASSWQWWSAVANEDFKSGLIYTDYKIPGNPETIYESKLLWTLGNYSRFIRPGMVRVELSGPQEIQGVLASAFLDVNSGRVVLVLVNEAVRPQKVQIDLKSATAKWFIPFTTSAEKNLLAGKQINIMQIFSVPPLSVMTLVSDAGQSSKPESASSSDEPN